MPGAPTSIAAAQCHHDQPEQEDALAPPGVGKRAGRHQRGAEAQHEGVGDPVELHRAAAQRVADRGQHHGGPGEAQRHAQRRQAHGGQQPVLGDGGGHRDGFHTGRGWRSNDKKDSME